VERIYRALVRLAGMALVAEIVQVVIIVYSQNVQRQAIRIGASGVSPTYIEFQLRSIFSTVTFMLFSGVTITGIVAAWAARRRRWLAPVSLLTVLELLWPYMMNLWSLLTPQSYSGTAPWLSESLTLSIFVMTLVPVALILVFARMGIRGAAHATTDADLDVIRSPL
jgi:hypothetical protein